MDAFFAAVEQLDEPSLRGRPVLVGGRGKRGVVCAASYEARVFGCHSAQPMATARRLCPQAVVLPGRFERYRELSNLVFEILRSASDLVQSVSIDEAYLDATATCGDIDAGVRLGSELRRQIRLRTGLTASVGVAPNRFLAKLASDMDKPDALVAIRPEQVHAILDPLPVGRIHGVGPAAEARLHRLGVRTVGQLRSMPPEVLRARFGVWGDRLHELARGVDERPVRSGGERKSLGHERTFGDDIAEPDIAAQRVRELALRVAQDLRRRSLRAKTVTLKLRDGSFHTVTRSRSLPAPTARDADLLAAAEAIWQQWLRSEGFCPLRLIGVTASSLSDAAQQQLELFEAV